VKRKVIQIADSTQLVSLPRKWAISQGIKKGDEVDVQEEGNRITVSAEKTPEIKKIEVDVSSLDRTSILYCIQSLYRLGYDEVKLKFDNDLTSHLRTNKEIRVISVINYTVNRLIGFEIIQQGEKSCTVKSLQECTIKEFEQVLRRIFMLLIEMHKDLIEALKTNNKSLIESMEEKHDNITKFVSYCLRTLNKVGYPDHNKVPVLYHIVSNTDKVVDIIKYASRDLLKHKSKLKNQSISILEMIQKSFELYYQLFYKFDIKTIKELSQNRDNTIKQLRKVSSKLSENELLFLSDMRSSLEIILDLTEARWGLVYQ